MARSPQTEAELRQRLVTKGYQEVTAAATVARCRELGWVNDVLFALDRARQLRRRGAGPLRIGSDLEGRGLPEGTIAVAIEESRDGRAERALALEALGPVPGDRAARVRAWRWLVGRGFPEELVAELIDESD